LSLAWIDVLTPKQALFFWPVAELLERRGLEVLLTARRYEQLDWLLRLLRLDATVIGRFGGEGLYEKLRSSTDRQRLLIRLIGGRVPSIAMSSGSLEVVRICFGLQISHLLVSDSPHSPVNKLCAPLSDKILTPFAVPRADWMVWGVSRAVILRYRALDPVAWIRRYSLLEGLAPRPPSGEYALVRVPEYKASYIRGRGLSETVEVVRRVARVFDRVLVMCRYRGEARMLRPRVPRSARLIVKPVLALPFIRRAAIVFSGGGTLAQEAALLGRPTVLFYPGETPAVHRYLASRGLLRVLKRGEYAVIERLCEDLASSRVARVLRVRAERLAAGMEDPALFVARIASGLLR